MKALRIVSAALILNIAHDLVYSSVAAENGLQIMLTLRVNYAKLHGQNIWF